MTDLEEIILEKRIEANKHLESKDRQDNLFGFGMINVINAVHTHILEEQKKIDNQENR